MYILGNWGALATVVVLYNFTPLKIEWIGLIVVGIYIAVYTLTFKRRGELTANEGAAA